MHRREGRREFYVSWQEEIENGEGKECVYAFHHEGEKERGEREVL